MGDGEFGHVVFFLAEGDEIIVDASLILPGIIEIKIFRLHIVIAKFLGFELRNLFQETLFLL